MTNVEVISTLVDIKATNVEIKMKLSEFELEVMQIYWQKGNLSAPDVHQVIAKTKDVTYSTVKTIIDRLEKKGALKRVANEGRTIFYSSAITPDSVKKPLLSAFIKKVFSGHTRHLFNHLFSEEKLSESDIEYLEQLIAEKKKSMRDSK